MEIEVGLCVGVHAAILLTCCAVYTSGIALLQGRVSSSLMQRTWRRSGGVARRQRFGVLPTWSCVRRRSRLQQPIAGSREQHACCAVLACVHVLASGTRHHESFVMSGPRHFLRTLTVAAATQAIRAQAHTLILSRLGALVPPPPPHQPAATSSSANNGKSAAANPAMGSEVKAHVPLSTAPKPKTLGVR